MKLKYFMALSAAGLMATAGCNKGDAAKTAPGTEAAKDKAGAAQPVQPAAAKPGEKPAEVAKTDGKAVDPKKPVAVENLKVEAATPGADKKTSADGETEETRVTGPVALVNGQAIDAALYYEEVDKIKKRSAKIPPERMNRIKDNILKRLIEKELIRQAVKKAEVAVPKAEIDAEFAEYKKRFRTDEQFQNYLKHGKVTVESIRSRISEKKELEKLLEKTGKLAVTDAEVDDFYKKNERFYQEREGVKARHVLIKLKENASKEEEEKARAKVGEVQAALKKGDAFEDVAKKFSEGPSGPKGGDLGFFGRGQMVKPFEEKAFAMKPNEVSDPIRTRFGFHIINVLEKREARKKPMTEVKETIKESLRNKKFFQERRTMLNTLKTEAKIERKIEIPKAPPRATRNPHEGIKMGNPHALPSARPPVPGVKPGAKVAPRIAPKPGAKAATPGAQAPTVKPAVAPGAKAAVPAAKAAVPAAKAAVPAAVPAQPAK
ncbi:MAG: peptidyl-prolyl cis-trans isomerase C [Myxococcota bacterium]|jgi:peptidyl-prolyl cis-trans isomerase C